MFRKSLNKQQMKGTFTFTDGVSNQTNLTNISHSEAKGNKFLFAKELLMRVKQLFIQEKIIEPRVNTDFIEKQINDVQTHTLTIQGTIVEAAIPVIGVKDESHFS